MNAQILFGDGASMPLHIERWMGPVTPEERTLLDFVIPPVLDVGCGPGRHVTALAESGIVTLGLDVSPSAVDLARTTGAAVLERSVFDRIPAAGRWGTALLLDGNVGIGGAPETLLRRLRELLHPRGRVLVELEAPGRPTRRVTATIERDGTRSGSFPWALVGTDGIEEVAASSGLVARRMWTENDRWFAQLDAR